MYNDTYSYINVYKIFIYRSTRKKVKVTFQYFFLQYVYSYCSDVIYVFVFNAHIHILRKIEIEPRSYKGLSQLKTMEFIELQMRITKKINRFSTDLASREYFMGVSNWNQKV